MRINHNLAALNTYRMETIAVQGQQKHIEKLSSGMKINRAADDAAGLSISEKMRGQIRGLQMASKNAQDGVSLVQVMEGGLNEIHSLLQRGRELAVQAASDTNVTVDREALQRESDQIVEEIDRIANTTEFNTISLLNRGANSKKIEDMNTEELIVNGLKSGWLEESEKMISTFYGLTPSDREIKVFLDSSIAGGTLAYVQTGWSTLGNTSTITDMELHIDVSKFTPSTGESGDNSMTVLGGKMYNDRIIAHEMVHAIMADQLGDDFFDMPTWFKEGTAELIHGADDRVEGDVIAAGGIQNVINRAEALIGGAAWNGDSLDYSASYLAVKYAVGHMDPGKTIKDIFAAIKDGNDAVDNTVGAIVANTTFADANDFRNTFKAAGAGGGADFYTNVMQITPGNGEADTGSIAGSDYGNPALNDEAVVATGEFNSNWNSFAYDFPEAYSFENRVETLSIQVGANQDQKITFELSNAQAKNIGVSSINLKTKAGEAITKFDKAILTVSTMRSSYGALSNRLEHSIKNLNNTSDNLQAAESRIRDADMAREMMELTKRNILTQSSQAMLSQANQQTQSVLSIIR